MSEQNGVGPTQLRHSIGVGEVLRYCSDTVSEQYRSRRGAPILLRHRVGVGEVLRYRSDTVSEQDRSGISINSRFIELFIQHISGSL